MSWFTKYASRTVQKAHARVTAENAHYVAEAIRQDATIERLIHERDQALARIADLALDNNRLARQLTVAWQDIEWLQRRWNSHVAVCPQAQAADDHSADKDRENAL